MSLILKIAAGVIIGLLVVQIATMKFIDYEHEKMSEDLILQQELRIRTTVLMNAVNAYYKSHQKLPALLADIDCTHHGECAVAKDDSVYYINYQGEWVLIEPYLLSNKLEYRCKSTHPDSNNPMPHGCIKIDKSDVPQSILNAVLKLKNTF